MFAYPEFDPPKSMHTVQYSTEQNRTEEYSTVLLPSNRETLGP